MKVDVEPAARPAEADYVIDLCRNKTGATRAAVIGGNPAAPGFEDYVKHAHASGFVRGVRQVLHAPSMPAGTRLKDDFVKSIPRAGKANKWFDPCTRPTEPPD